MSAKKKILIVDDDDMLRQTLAEQISLHDEFQVTDVNSATLGVKTLKSDAADLVILDVNLPDMDGREACKIMRRNGYKGPVIMLTGQGSDSDMILGLDSGANDYVVKPFRFAVCSHASARNCASTNTRKMRCSASDPTPSSPRKNCWSGKTRKKSASRKRKQRSSSSSIVRASRAFRAMCC